jgi:hypothetical protein
MFRGSVIWRGLIYTILMAFGKLVCGLWLVRIPISPLIPPKLKAAAMRIHLPRVTHFWGASATKSNAPPSIAQVKQDQAGVDTSPGASSSLETWSNDLTADGSTSASRDHLSPHPPKPISLYPSSILGGAMVARGEIGFLISSVAESKGIFLSNANETVGASQIFLVVTWAIVLCTIIGPLCVGFPVRRVKYLQAGVEKDGRNVRTDVLGVWGVE